MQFRMLACVFLVSMAMAAPTSAAAQKQLDPRLEAACSHFVGHWQGTNDFVANGQPIHKSLRITIKMGRKHGRPELRMDYVYDANGQEKAEALTRYMAFDPATSTVTLRWSEDLRGDRYNAKGLDKLLSDGYGTFTIVDTRKNTDIPQDKGVFYLTANQFGYLWQTTRDGTDSTPRSSFNLSRVE